MVDNTSYIYNRLVAGGVSPIGAMGLLGNWKAESGTGISPTAQNPAGAYGIAQWNDRKPALLSYLSGRGLSSNDLDGQIDFALKELHGPESATLTGLNNATNIRDATIAGVGYERPEGWTAKNPTGANDFSRRLNYAQQTQGLLGSGDSGSSYNQSAAPPTQPGPTTTVNPQQQPGPMAPTSAGGTPTNPAGASPDAGLLGALASGGPSPQQTSASQGLASIASALKPAAAPDPAPQMPQDPGMQLLQQKRQMAMQAAQKYMPSPQGFTGLLG